MNPNKIKRISNMIRRMLYDYQEHGKYLDLDGNWCYNCNGIIKALNEIGILI